jgi:hypothetical protein
MNLMHGDEFALSEAVLVWSKASALNGGSQTRATGIDSKARLQRLGKVANNGSCKQ